MFSDREESIIKIIGKKTVTLEQISKELFKSVKDKPFDTNISVANSVRRVIKKCLHYDLSWTLKKSRSANKLLIKRDRR